MGDLTDGLAVDPSVFPEPTHAPIAGEDVCGGEEHALFLLREL
jgi:hypothetical protein